MLYDENWKKYGFPLKHQQLNLDNQGRLQLKKVLDNFEFKAVIDNDGHTFVTGQPLLFCATLTKPPN